ncbi:MAG: flagellar basal body protein [Acidobacteriota bacterium]|nr:flagellar basal body protein [Acidobacteriota bacterium]
MGVFDQYSIGTSAMRAFRLGMNIAGYNVANANTPGFSRRRVELGTMATIAVPGGYAGMGVDVESLHRIRDPFLDFAVRRESTRFGFDSSRAEVLGGLEPALGEVDSAALRASISSFFDSLENLAIQPDDSAIRQDVVSAASYMASTIRQVDGFIGESRRNADDKAVEQVDRINEVLSRLSRLNLEVTGLEAGGQEASDVGTSAIGCLTSCRR